MADGDQHINNLVGLQNEITLDIQGQPKVRLLGMTLLQKYTYAWMSRVT